MKLNPDCIRDILLNIEGSIESVDVFIHYDADTIHAIFPKYSVDEVLYHLRQCELNNFFFKSSHGSDYHYYDICDLTPTAHTFLNNIRQDNIWNSVKSIGAKVGSRSLDALIQISSNVITAIIQSQLTTNGIIS